MTFRCIKCPFVKETWYVSGRGSSSSNKTLSKVSKQIWNRFQAACGETEFASFGIELWGGATSQVDPEATAFHWRGAVYNVHLWLEVPTSIEDARKRYASDVATLDTYWQGIAKHLVGIYVNYAEASLTRQEYATATYGGNLEPLMKLKQELDPDDVFHNPQSIPVLQ